ncbi:MAG: DNA-directed DNA polymerase [Gammaproteobacteria bacterium]|jgi:DNA polymerase-3 subunit delta
MKCESTALGKYLETSKNIFFIYGSEVVLRNNAKDDVKSHLNKKGFFEKRTITKENFDQIENIIIESSGGSLFGSKIIIDIHHDQGKLPENIAKIFEIPNIDSNEHVALIINSHNEKLNKNTKLYKTIDKFSLIIECRKLKSFEEKIWLKNQLNFIADKHKHDFVSNIYEMNIGNLVAQQNEVNILKLLYNHELGLPHTHQNDSSIFEPFELENAVIDFDTKNAIRIIHSIKESDAHYGPLLVWIIGKIVNSSAAAKQANSTKQILGKLGIWSSKIPSYMNFIKIHSLKSLIGLQKEIYMLDLTSKGLTKRNFWNDIDNIIIRLTTS